MVFVYQKVMESYEKLSGFHSEKLASSNKLGFAVSNWIKILFNKTPEEEFKAESKKIDEYKHLAEESMQNAFRVVHLSHWKKEKEGALQGDVVESNHSEQFGKVYRFTGIVDCPPEFLFQVFKSNVSKMPDWNPTIRKSEFIQEVSPGIDLSYQVTTGAARGIVSPRDFVILRRCAALDRQGRVVESDPYCYISTGMSVNLPEYPPQANIVRGNNKVGCWCLTPVLARGADGRETRQTQFQWLICCDIRGQIPQFVLNAVFPTILLKDMVYVRKFTADAKAKGLF